MNRPLIRSENSRPCESGVRCREILRAARGAYPTADIDRMLTEIEGGYLRENA